MFGLWVIELSATVVDDEEEARVKSDSWARIEGDDDCVDDNWELAEGDVLWAIGLMDGVEPVNAIKSGANEFR